MKKSVINFNHICKDLGEVKTKELKDLYYCYHKYATCFKWRWKKLERQQLSLTMTSIGLTSIGAVVGVITLNPIVLGVLSGFGILVQGYTTKKKVNAKVRDYKTAFTTYSKILNQLKSYLRGVSFDDVVFLSDVKVIDDYITDLGLSVEGMSKTYDRTYETW